MRVYENAFDANEWFILLLLAAGYTAVWFLRRGLPVKQGLFCLLFGIFMGLFLDHLIAIEPIDFYDVNDKSDYEFMDFLTYIMYGPPGFLFAYWHNRFSLSPRFDPLYCLGWTALSIGLEWAGMQAGVYHYLSGYQIYYSPLIYLFFTYIYLLVLYTLGILKKAPSA